MSFCASVLCVCLLTLPCACVGACACVSPCASHVHFRERERPRRLVLRLVTPQASAGTSHAGAAPTQRRPPPSQKVFTAPPGLYFAFRRGQDAHVFLLTFALFAIYFSGIMVR